MQNTAHVATVYLADESNQDWQMIGTQQTTGIPGPPRPDVRGMDVNIVESTVECG